MTESDWTYKYSDQRTGLDADQVEVSALRHGTSPVDEGTRDDRVAQALDDHDVPDPQQPVTWARDQATEDTASGAIADELNRRQRILDDAYPFVLEGSSLRYRGARNLIYELCLAISSATNYSAAPFNALPIAFERLSRQIVEHFVGTGAVGRRTGWPHSGENYRTAEFESCAKELNRLTDEWVWNPADGLPAHLSTVDGKDLGIDFVVWKQIPDRRRGALFLVGQCACGQNFDTKLSELNLTLLEKTWFRPLSSAPAVRLFMTPRHIVNDAWFGAINTEAGLTFDRSRIAILAHDVAGSFIAEEPRPVLDLIRIVFDWFRVVRPKPLQPRRIAAAGRRSQSPSP